MRIIFKTGNSILHFRFNIKYFWNAKSFSRLLLWEMYSLLSLKPFINKFVKRHNHIIIIQDLQFYIISYKGSRKIYLIKPNIEREYSTNCSILVSKLPLISAVDFGGELLSFLMSNGKPVLRISLSCLVDFYCNYQK